MLEIFTTAINGLPHRFGFVELIDGWVVTPKNKGWLNDECKDDPIIIDNGAYSAYVNNEEINPVDSLQEIEQLILKYNNQIRFAVIPDKVGDNSKTLQYGVESASIINNNNLLKGVPWAFVIQNGYNKKDIIKIISQPGFMISYLFIGGNGWDFKRAAIDDLKDLGIKLHVGAISKFEQLIYCHSIEAVESVDNSTFSNGLNSNNALKYIERILTLKALDSGVQRRLNE